MKLLESIAGAGVVGIILIAIGEFLLSIGVAILIGGSAVLFGKLATDKLFKKRGE